MKIKLKFIVIIIFFLTIIISKSYSYTAHYKNFKKIEMDIYRNGELIGFSIYEFINNGNILEVINKTEFKVKVLGVKLFSINSIGKEKYENDQLIEFKSETLQNRKKKFVNLKFDQQLKIFKIVGSSYEGTANKNNIVGNWWNHKILTATSQISPLSGSVKQQEVTFISREIININGKNFEVDLFKLKSTDDNLEADKRLDFDIWYDSKNNIIVKVEYNRLGKWQYILKNIKKN
tara:strand:- start:1375 stop:2076 length:702 start_codon:yes stop_codon:yes gene_type:complete